MACEGETEEIDQVRAGIAGGGELIASGVHHFDSNDSSLNGAKEQSLFPIIKIKAALCLFTLYSWLIQDLFPIHGAYSLP